MNSYPIATDAVNVQLDFLKMREATLAIVRNFLKQTENRFGDVLTNTLALSIS